MSLKSYSKGSEFPPLENGKLRLYSMRFCPFAQRTRLVLAHKNIEFETINVDLKNKPDWFLERNPLGLVPVLEQDDKVVYESVVCNEYLDDIYTQEKLTPDDPYRRARDKILLEYNGKLVTNFYKFVRSQGQDQEAQTELNKNLEIFEKAIEKRGAYFGGDKVAMLDFFVWPWFERMSPLKTMNIEMLPEEKFPNLNQWVARMRNLPAVKATLFDDQSHLIFMKSYSSGQPNYDFGL